MTKSQAAAKWTSKIGDYRVGVSRAVEGTRTVTCKGRTLGTVWRREGRGHKPWRSQRARGGAIDFHRSMSDAVNELVDGEARHYAREYAETIDADVRTLTEERTQ